MSTTGPQTQREFDYVIVGAGTAGCVMAARLTEDPQVRVCLVEAGPMDSHPFFHVPALVGAAIGRPDTNWRFLTVPQPQLENRRIPTPRGRVVGGSGSINGMVYFRGYSKDYDEWAAAGNAGWGWRDVLPYFLRSENNRDYGDSPYHSQGGPIAVRHIARPNKLNAAFRDAFASLGGFQACADFTGPDPEGYGLRQGTIRRGRRSSTAVEYLRPAAKRTNLTILTKALTQRLELHAGHARGIEIEHEGKQQRLTAHREVILCAGAVQSPHVLMLSGIGDPAHLEQHGIEVKHALPGVGANYHDHLAVAVLMEMSNTTSYGLSWRTTHRSLWNGLQYALARGGPLASNVFESTAFIRSTPGLDRPDLQIVFQPARRNPNTFPLPLGHGYALSTVSLYPQARGTIRLSSADPREPPRIDPNLLGDPADMAPLVRGLQLSRRLFAAKPFARYDAVEVSPGSKAQTNAELEAHVRKTSSTVHHPVGSCRMGVDAGAVVDPQLRVHGITGLRVVDGSIMPRLIGGNTNAPIVMIAEKAVDMMLGRPALAPFNVPTAETLRKSA